MKKYIVKILLFFFIIFTIDFVFGKVCDYLRDHTKGGFSGNIHYICEQCDEDIIMMGSSRMRHHYVPQIFEDSLGMSCYNTGIDGNGIILSYGFLEMILNRYTPKLIIYDVTRFDMFVDDNVKYLGTMKPYYDNPGIADIFDAVQPSEKIKMKSKLYRYNSALFGLISDNYKPLQSFEKGYWPSYKTMNYEPQHKERDNNKNRTIDSLKINYVKAFIKKTRQSGIKLYFVASPTYYGKWAPDYFDEFKAICREEKIEFIDCYYDSIICTSKEYWSDATHMNNKGAELFSRQLAGRIKGHN